MALPLNREKSLQSAHFTVDFRPMLQIVMWNCFGMFYLEFLIPIIAKELLQATGFQIGLLVSVQVIGYLLSSSFVGFLTDRTSKTRLVLIGSYGRGVAYLIIYAAILGHSLEGLAVGTFFLGFGAGWFWIPFNALVAQKSDKNHRSEAYGRREAEIGKGTFIGATLGFTFYGFMQDYDIASAVVYLPILVYALANFFAGFQFHRHVDEKIVFISLEVPAVNSDAAVKETREADPQNSLKQALLIGIAILAAVLFLSSLNGSIARPFIQAYLLNNVTTDETEIMLIYIPAGIIALILAPKLGRLADKLHPAVGITVGSVCGAGITYLFIISTNIYLLAFLLTLDTTCVNLANLSIQNLLSRTSIVHRGKVMGLQAIVSNLGQVIGPVSGGTVWDLYGDRSPFLVSIFIEILLIPLYWLAIRFIIPHLAEKKTHERVNPAD